MDILNRKHVILDRFGMLLSGLCAFHCSVLPIVLLFGIGTGYGWLVSHEVEVLFLSISFALACLSLVSGYVKRHRNLYVLIIALIGFILFGIGHEFMPFLFKIIFTTLGGICILYAHYLNLRYISIGYNLAGKG
jgi:hypothetical protein